MSIILSSATGLRGGCSTLRPVRGAEVVRISGKDVVRIYGTDKKHNTFWRDYNRDHYGVIETYVKAKERIFEGLIKEIRELSRKKPDATMSASKVKIVNRVLDDLLGILKAEPTGKYLEILSDESLPQVSDAVLTMVQFESALEAFKSKYYQYVADEHHWITQETLDAWNAEEEEEEEEKDPRK